MKVISVNRSSKIKINYEGKIIETGIFKKPVTGSVTVSKTHIEGDEQADLKNHGGKDKAVYGFSSSHYLSWQAELNLSSLPYGSFGENLTISNLSESDIMIGDQFRIGSCILEVSQPRVPCFKLGIALGDKRMPRFFTQSAETGVYFRVIKEGAVTANDDVVLHASSSVSVSIKELFRSVFDKTYENSEQVIRKAVDCPALADEWALKLKQKLL